ncbi:MAG: response regulator transcription factor [Oscillospiraceae bacterium]|nr:response regulator transcription factor [Oscillospiraceae bacterium]
MNPKILVVEDERSIRNFISTILTANSFDVLEAHNGQDAYSMITSHCPDLVVLDLGLPDMDGMKIIKQVRAWSSLPIVVVSARVHERDKVEALDAGADDYMTKPFGTSELLARLRTALRHTHVGVPGTEERGVFRAGGLSVDFDKRRVLVDGEDTHLTLNEYRIVAFLGRFAGKVLTYDTIMREVWGPSAGGNNQILRVNMANIRRKLEKNPAAPEYIFTEVGVGYRMREAD